MNIRKVLMAALAALFLWFGCREGVAAGELEGTCAMEGTGALSKLSDGDYGTGYKFEAGDVITVTAPGGEKITGIYVIWDSPVKPWTLRTETDEIPCGQNEFLHEYVVLEQGQTKLELHIEEGGVRISDIYIFGEGDLPDWVQVWLPPCEKADIMLVSSHADDEILFFGGIIPTYYVGRGATVQVVYMTEYWTGQKVREHEKLDGLWASGLDIYPVCGNFKDVYSKTLEQAQEQYDTQAMVDYVTEQLRRFQPQVVVSHDVDGEYGHGFHMLTSRVVRDAVEAAPLAECHEASADVYGIWDVPKTYLHLYEKDGIRLDLRIPMEGFQGLTALEVATEAYKQHKSQQWCWFYVSDDYKYSCAEFGLYRTTVGPDTVGENAPGDMLENIVTYEEQERLEQERLEAERLEAERLKAEQEAEKLRQEMERLKEEAAKREAARQEQERLEAERLEAERLAREQQRMEAFRRTGIIVLFGCGLLVAVVVSVFIIKKRRRSGR